VSEPAIRLLVAVGVIASALVFAAVLNRYRRPVHPTVSVGEVGDRPGVVLFTSTDCSNCKRTIERLKQLGMPYREVTYELESQRFDSWGVVAVPLTVFVDGDGHVEDVLTGVPSRRKLVGAAKASGVLRDQ
jgi:thiol-disulfide isomerase/thioredoxin